MTAKAQRNREVLGRPTFALQNSFQFAPASQKAPARIDIYGDIFPAEWGGIDETVIADALNQIGDVAAIDVHINSRGGSVFTGWAMRNLLAQHSATKNVYIDGVAASSAATIAMTLGGAVHMPANALVMFHESQIFVMGSKTAITTQLQQAEKIDAACIALFMEVTGKSESDIKPLFNDDNETWMNAKDAADFGFQIVTLPALPTKTPDTTSTQSLFSFRHAPATAVALLATIPDGVAFMTKPTETNPTTNTPAPTQTVAPTVTESAPAPSAGAGATQQATQQTSEVSKTPEAAAPPPTVVTLTAEQLTNIVSGAVTQALATHAKTNENEDIRATCQLASCTAEQTQSYIDRKFTLAEVRQQLGQQLNGAAQPPAQGGGAGGDAYQKYRTAYEADRERFQAAGISAEQFIKRRCLDDGIAPPAETK